ncbi:MAG: alpha/beta hydrolase [Alphaproteobacteria bacterium]|nr:MAG: alpha/beta hydrolase [Alphaproteobacteria bacterium]
MAIRRACLPPTLILVASDEALRDDVVRRAERLRAAGCDVELELCGACSMSGICSRASCQKRAQRSRASVRSCGLGYDIDRRQPTSGSGQSRRFRGVTLYP